MSLALGEHVRAVFARPRSLSPVLSGIDLSASGVKAVELQEGPFGLEIIREATALLPAGAFSEGDIMQRAAIESALKTTAYHVGITKTNVALPEKKIFLFELEVRGEEKYTWRKVTEEHIASLVPLDPAEVTFDVVPLGPGRGGGTLLAGVAFPKRVVDQMLSLFEEAGIEVRSLEAESFAMARALLPKGDQSTTLIIDIGKTTTKLTIVSRRIPRFSATINIGGHGFTLAAQKYFGVTELESRRIKAEQGISRISGNEIYTAAMLSVSSSIGAEINSRLTHWQHRAASTEGLEPVSRAILAGGNASVRGLTEYFEILFGIPVSAGDVFTNLASHEERFPSLDYGDSLTYATAIGLALREQTIL